MLPSNSIDIEIQLKKLCWFQLKHIYQKVYGENPDFSDSHHKKIIDTLLVKHDDVKQYLNIKSFNTIERFSFINNDYNKHIQDIPMLVQWKDHPSDDALYHFYRSIVADYSTLDQAKTKVEQRFHNILNQFQLIPKGSYGHRIALKNYSDLDLDLVLPRSLVSQEDLDLMSTNSDTKIDETMSEICNELQQQLLKSPQIVKQSNEKLTRGLKVKIKVEDQLDIECDIFPKVLDRHGNICYFGKQLEGNQQRCWIKTKLNRSLEKVELTEEEKATILLLKLWKRKSEPKLKGYLIALAVERVVHFNKNNDDLSNEKVLIFSREKIRKNMLDVAKYMVEAFQTRDFNEKFDFINDGQNPFVNETNKDYINSISKSLQTFIQDLENS